MQIHHAHSIEIGVIGGAGGYEMTHHNTHQIKHDLAKVFNRLDQLADSLTEETTSRAGALAARMGEGTHAAGERLHDIQDAASVRARRIGRQARDQVRRHPWSTAAIALTAVVAATAIAVSRNRSHH
jgi:ElaB/YqjD/DUF883 family membrane-anchored ribosome-binding protein